MPRRKVPFSGKAKKQQLKVKKHKSGNIGKANVATKIRGHAEPVLSIFLLKIRLKVRKDSTNCGFDELEPGTSSKMGKAERYKLQLGKEKADAIEEKKKQAFATITLATENKFILQKEAEDYFPIELSFPKRPEWSYKMNVGMLEDKENQYFQNFKAKLIENFQDDLGYWEQNLETWRQFWRVLELSDIILFIVDIRYVNALFAPSLYDYCTVELKKPLVIILNKIDLIPDTVVLAWMDHLKSKFPMISIVLFTSISRNADGKKSKKQSKLSYEVASAVQNVCQEAMIDKFDLSSWKEKIEKEFNSDYRAKTKDETYSDKYMTIGCIGQPNAGKSSFINAMVNKKVVSVSKTPGHTKHFQTIFVAENVRLCDCPGLVFPSFVPKELQVLSGCYPVSQLSNPYTTICFMAERIDLIGILKLVHPEGEDSWSAMDVCNAWAIKRGFFTKRGARPDSYRAANSLLRMALDGSVTIYSIPVDYEEIVKEDDERLEFIRKIKKSKKEAEEEADYKSEKSESESGDSETEESSEEEQEIVCNMNKFSVLEADD